jgi:hypothetical protein
MKQKPIDLLDLTLDVDVEVKWDSIWSFDTESVG